ncbi:Pyrophosphate--fructose 6-phosphate 1-phosphotransferase subunit alpha [Cucurbita argyrosperma subsp. argyrosperma]|nr:Pyrophosphate--fructose 6-phosphate 1-phosphotransferase subunit alpha [Cucurbita argyrosperma subsp. argyrosperma]
MEAEISDDQIIGKAFEDQDYLEKITKLQGYLDEVKKIVRESCSEEVLEVALSSVSSLISILSSMASSSSFTKLHSSL